MPDQTENLDGDVGVGRRHALLQKHRWLGFVLPLAAYMLAGTLESHLAYPAAYSLKLVLTLAAMALVWPVYRQFAPRIHPISILVGVMGVVAWVGLCNLQLESRLAAALGLDGVIDFGARAGYNPLESLSDTPGIAYAFLTVRFLGLALIVPVIEEFFLRGFVMRFVMEADWWKVPFGQVNRAAILAGTAIPVLMHPMSELLAVVVWFSMVTLLMVKTRNIWDCVAAHVVTNLLLGVYVVWSGAWHLW